MGAGGFRDNPLNNRYESDDELVLDESDDEIHLFHPEPINFFSHLTGESEDHWLIEEDYEDTVERIDVIPRSQLAQLPLIHLEDAVDFDDDDDDSDFNPAFHADSSADDFELDTDSSSASDDETTNN